MAEPGRPEDQGEKQISARDARGGEIILRTRLMRIVFIAGLVGLLLVAIFVWL